MEKEKKPIQAFYMPQISCPYTFVQDNLKDFGFEYYPTIVTVGQLTNTQPNVDHNKVKDMSKRDDLKTGKPVYISENDKILDGHHRVAAIKYVEGDKGKVRAIRIMCNDKDGLCVLKLIQDRWEQKHGKQK